MKRIAILILTTMLISSMSFAQKVAKDTTKKVSTDTICKTVKDTTKKEIVIKDGWSSTKKKPTTKRTYYNKRKTYSGYYKNKKTRKNYSHQTNIGVGNAKLRIKENRDTTIIGLGNKELIISDSRNGRSYYNLNIRNKDRKSHFRGHWTGFEIGIASFKEQTDGFMELTYPKSSAVNINFLQYNIPIAGNNFGMVTGMGLSWYNFRFKDKVTMEEITVEGKSYTTQVNIADRYNNDDNIKKSKLTMSYLTVPVLFELQSNNRRTYIAVGVIGGVKLGSHTKIKFKDNDKEKDYDDFYIRPFKADATVRLGLGICKIWGTYSLTPLFEKDKLYDSANNEFVTKTPIAVGLSFNIF